MRKKICLIILLIICLMPLPIKAYIEADVDYFDNWYNNMIKNKKVTKELTCDTEEKDMANSGIFQYAETDKETADLGEETVDTKKKNDPECDNDYYNELYEGQNLGKVNVKKELTANYYLLQSGILEIEMDRGPIHAGGKFEFKMSYINTFRYYIEELEDEVEPDCEYPDKVKILMPEEIETCDEEGNCIKEYEKIQICKDSTLDAAKRGNIKKYCPDEKEQIEITYCKPKSVSYTKPKCKPVDGKKVTEALEKKVQKRIQIRNSNAEVTVSSKSNKVTGDEKMDGEWECNDTPNKLVVEDGEYVEKPSTPDDYLDSKNEWITRCEYKLDAKLDLNSADVTYNDTLTKSGNFKLNVNTYYIPLKYPTKEYKVKAFLTDLSNITDVTWTANYNCTVDVVQLMYNLEDGGFKFIYRPILITMPFPDSGNKREPSKNWITWWEKSSNQQKLAASYSNLEYAINLSPTDMRNIKTYNEEKYYNGGKALGYLDYSINKDGSSNFSYVQSGRKSNDYSELGEFKGEDS